MPSLRQSSLFLLLLLLTACLTSAQTNPETTPKASQEPCVQNASDLGPCSYPINVNPLTGLEVANPESLNRRPIDVKISNSPAIVRPQSGISEADLVFEHYTEVGITRFSAIFYTNAPQRVGSIRSARLIDYELVPMYQGLLAFAGASIGVDKRIYGSETIAENLCQTREDYDQCLAEANIIGPAGFIPPSDFVDRAYKGVLYGSPYFFRDESIPAPHNLFANLESLWQLAANDGNGQRPDLHGMAFSANPQGTPTGSGVYAQVRYSTTLVEWHYDPETARYYRSTDGQLHFDANTETQVSAANVVIVYAGHYETDIIESQFADTIHWSLQITLWPEGGAVILRDGVRYEGRWLRQSRPELMSFETNEGEIIYLKPGNTWFQVVQLPEQMNPEREWVVVE
jgi:hypothetical protein